MNICPIITIDLFRQRRRFLCHQQLNCSTVSSGIQKVHGAIMGVGGSGGGGPNQILQVQFVPIGKDVPWILSDYDLSCL